MKSRIVLTAAATALALCTGTATRAAASELIYYQPSDPQSTYGPSQFFDEPLSNGEIADDFEVVGSIGRIQAEGFVWGAVTWQGAFIRFYEYGADGKPGALQHQVYVPVSDPNLTVSPFGTVDVVLATPFQATGRHFLSVQAHANYWYWWSSNTGAPRGEPYFYRDLAAGETAWRHGDSQPGSQPNADVAFALYGTVSSPGTITSLSANAAPRGGYLEILGTNFGGSGQVKVGGAPAPIADWSSTRIVAYVPANAPTGTASVQVVSDGGSSNEVGLSVIEPVPDGRVNWRIRLAGSYARVRPARGPDGTIYVVDVNFHLYAVNPEGGVLWVARGAGNKGLTVGPDGTIYTGSESDVKAYRPDGSLRWTFVQEPRAFILIGPAVGPDGNIYGVSTSGIGVFSLDPNGNLRWTNPETYRRPIVDYGEIAFGPNGADMQMYFYANDHVRALRLSDGASVFTLGVHGQPVTSPLDGSVHILNTSWSPGGEMLWAFAFPNFTSPSIASLAADGTHYVVNSTNTLYAIDPDGNERWHLSLPSPAGAPDVDPTHDIVVLPRTGPLTEPGFVQAIGIEDRREAWRVDFPAEEPSVFNPWTAQYGFHQYVDTRLLFDPDGATTHFVTAIATGELVADRCFLYSVSSKAAQPVLTDAIGDPLRSTRLEITPNPSRAATSLRFELRAPATVQVRIHDVAGRLVRDLGSLPKQAGRHAVAWDGRDRSGNPVAAGVYVATIAVGDRATSTKLLRVR